MRSRTCARSSAAALIFVLALHPTLADAAWWNIFKRDNGDAEASVGKAPVPPASVNNAAPGGGNSAVTAAPTAGIASVTAPAAPVSPTANAGAIEPLSVRLDRAEAQIRSLNGQIEQLTYQLRNAQDQLREAGLMALDAAPASAAKRGDSLAALEKENAVPASPGAVAVPPPGNAPLSIASLSVAGQAAAPAPAPAAAAAPPPAKIVTSIAPAGDPRSAYEGAYQKILTGDYEVAEKGLRDFLAAYPSDKLAGDAQYWLGESYYARALYREAAASFLSGYKTYPKSARAAETLLKLGLSLKGLGQREEACNTFAEVLKRYPKSSNAMIQRVKAEQSGASCV